MDKLITAFYVAVYLIVTYGRKALIILTAFLSVVFMAMGLNNEHCFTMSLLCMTVMIVAICRYYDCKYADKEKPLSGGNR